MKDPVLIGGFTFQIARRIEMTRTEVLAIEPVFDLLRSSVPIRSDDPLLGFGRNAGDIGAVASQFLAFHAASSRCIIYRSFTAPSRAGSKPSGQRVSASTRAQPHSSGVIDT